MRMVGNRIVKKIQQLFEKVMIENDTFYLTRDNFKENSVCFVVSSIGTDVKRHEPSFNNKRSRNVMFFAAERTRKS